MNQHAKIKNAAPTSVTTGPIRGSGKVYAAPEGAPRCPRPVPRDHAD